MDEKELTALVLDSLDQGLAEERPAALGTLAALLVQGRDAAFGTLRTYAVVIARGWSVRRGAPSCGGGMWAFCAVQSDGTPAPVEAAEPERVFAMRFATACANGDEPMMRALFDAATSRRDPFHFPMCAAAVYDLALETLRETTPDGAR